MTHIEPLGLGVVLPAILIGYELREPGEDAAADGLQDDPDWLLIVDQQAGGYSMSYPTVMGAVLRLEANADKAHGPIGWLVRGLKAMAEDPDEWLLKKEYPLLYEMVRTRGDPYDGFTLQRLEQVIGNCFRIPPLSDGIEAFIRCKGCDPLEYFGGWRLLSCHVPDAGMLSGSPNCVEQVNVEQAVFLDREWLGASHIDRIRSAGRAVGRENDAPSVFLLWENSD